MTQESLGLKPDLLGVSKLLSSINKETLLNYYFQGIEKH